MFLLVVLLMPLSVMAAPVINAIELFAGSLGGSHTINLIINASDSLQNLSNSTFGSTVGFFTSNNQSNISIGTTLAQNGNVVTNNTLNELIRYPLNFTLTNNSYIENSYSHNITYQRIQKNDSLRNNQTECEQESVNISTGCGGLATGIYSESGNWNDGNLSSFTTVSAGNSFLWNATVPNWANNNSMLQWDRLIGCGSCDTPTAAITNFSLVSCFNQNNTLLQFNYTFNSTGSTHLLSCNQQTISFIQTVGCIDCAYTRFYEEKIWWRNLSRANNFTYNVTHATPTGATIITGGSIVGNLPINDTITIQTVWSGDWLGEIYGSYTQNTANQSESGGVAYIRRQINVTNNQTVTFNNVATNTTSLSGWGCTFSSTINVPTTGYHNASYETCSNGSILTRTRNRYNLTGTTNVTVGTSYSAFLEAEVNNTHNNISFNNILINVTPILPSTLWNIQSAATDNSTNVSNLSRGLFNFTINITNLSYELFTIIDSRCTGFNINPGYCLLITDLGTNGTLRTTNYTVRQFLNISDNVSSGYRIYYTIDKGRARDWINKTNGTDIVSVNSSSYNISLIENSTSITFLIDTNHTFNSTSNGSLNEGIWTVDLSYTTTTLATGGGGTSGAGGGGAGIQSQCGNFACEIGENKDNCKTDCTNLTWTLTPEFWRVPVIPGECIEKDFIINNYFENTKLQMRAVVDGATEGSAAWTDIKVANGQYSKSISFEVPFGVQKLPGRTQLFVKSCPPLGSLKEGEANHEYKIIIQTLVGSGIKNTPFIVVAGTFPDIFGLSGGLLSNPIAMILIAVVALVIIGSLISRR